MWPVELKKFRMAMRIERVDACRFAGLFPEGCPHMFNSVAFTELNRGKCDDIHYLAFADSRVRVGIVLGERGGRLLSPFSAPFGGFCYNNSRQMIGVTDEAVALLGEYAVGRGMKAELFLPPDFYAPELLPKFKSSLLRKGRLMYADVNYHYPLERVPEGEWEESVAGWMNSKSRMKFRKALRIPFRVELLDRNREEDVERVYGIIAANRAHKGYPLRMSLDDVKRTAEVARAEFIAMSLEGRDVAAALVYRVAPGIMQVVYWGDAPGWEELYPMHRFAPEVFHICWGLGAGILDIGPSSEDGIPSEGLCFFKESIGCLPSLKPRFEVG